jgi:Family of unknown function (DUF6064)
MSTNATKATLETPVERTVQRTDLNQSNEYDRPEDIRPVRRRSIEALGLAAAVVATIVIYVLFTIFPRGHETLNTFLAKFAHGNAEVWPMQLVWYACAVAMVGLAFCPSRRATQLICVLAAANIAWEGIVYFGIQRSDMHLAWLWATVFVLEAFLVLVAGVVRRDLVIAPRRDVAAVLGAVGIVYALVAYPLMGPLSGHSLSTLPVFGLSPCATVIFYFGLLLWARPPAPPYLLPLLLAWSLNAAPGALATGIVVDVGMVVAGVAATGVLIWRGHTSIWQTIAAGLVLALMAVWSGQDSMLIGIALILTALTVTQTLRGGVSRLSASRSLRPVR